LSGKDETAGEIHDKLMEIGADMVVQTTQGLIERNVDTRVQKSFIQGSEVLKPAPKLTRELCHIDWDDSTKQVYNLIRGLSPYPAAYTELVKDGSAPIQIKIYSAEPVDPVILSGVLSLPKDGAKDLVTEPSGMIVSDGKSYLWITTKDGAISLKEVQLAGKKRMGIEAFLLGFRDPGTYSTTPGTSKAEIDKTKVSQ
jgi:methionyl-tRNA formyltransferase